MRDGAPPARAETPSHADILEAVKELSEKVGWVDTDEHGKLIGKGLMGDVGRLRESMAVKFNWFDTTVKMILAAVAAGSVFVGVIWWLAAPNLDKVFHPQSVTSTK